MGCFLSFLRQLFCLLLADEFNLLIHAKHINLREPSEELRSPTFSLMTMAIGTGFLELNVAWMGNHFSASELVTIMVAEGIFFF